jgi:hypothetical protein
LKNIGPLLSDVFDLHALQNVNNKTFQKLNVRDEEMRRMVITRPGRVLSPLAVIFD